MLRVSLTLALWLACTSVPALADELGEETVVSTELCSRLWIIDLVWAPEGREPQDLVGVFDTGGGSAFIDPDALERISGQRIAEGKKARMKDMSVAGLSFSTFKPKVKDLDHISRALGRQLDVFLPFQTFDNYLLVLDYPAGEMRIRTGELPKPDGITVFDAKGRDDRPWLKVPVGRIERNLLIDSGSSGSITVHPHKKLDWVADPIPLRLFQGMYDIELMKVGRLDGMAQVGPLAFADPLVALTEDTELLGAQVLRHFVLTFDQKKRRVMMEPASTGPVPTESYQGTGIILRPRKDSYEIAHVIAGSPAADHDLKKGDRVTHLNGVPVGERGCRGMDEEAPATTTLTFVRDNETFDVTLANAILIP